MREKQKERSKKIEPRNTKRARLSTERQDIGIERADPDAPEVKMKSFVAVAERKIRYFI